MVTPVLTVNEVPDSMLAAWAEAGVISVDRFIEETERRRAIRMPQEMSQQARRPRRVKHSALRP